MSAVPARGVVDTIVRTWRAPRAVMGEQVAAGLTEPRSLVQLMLACGLFFVASLPMAVRTSTVLSVDEPVSAAVSAHLFAWGAVAPLAGYGLAALVHLAARAFGARGGFLDARAALFWSGLAVSPAVLAIGAAGAFAASLTGRVVPQVGWLAYPALALWVWIFAASLAETEGFASTGRVAVVVVAVLAIVVALFEIAAARNGVR